MGQDNMHFERHHISLLGNRNEIAINVMLVLFSLGEGLISVFVPIYLWKMGLPIAQVMFFYFLNSFFYIVVFLLLFDLVKRLSDKVLLVISMPFIVIYYLGLGYLDKYDWLFYLLPLCLAINIFLFWVGYHLNYISSIGKDHIGHSVGVRTFAVSVFSLIAPFLGGLLIYFFGFMSAFSLGSIIMFLSMLPVLFFSRRNHFSVMSRKDVFNILADKNIMPFTLSGIGYAAESSVSRIVWPLFIFLIIGSISEFGAIVSIGLILGAIFSYLVGVYSDRGKRQGILTVTTWLQSLIYLARGFFYGPSLVIGNNILANVVSGGLGVAWSTEFYKIAKRHELGLFIMSIEILYHLVRVVWWAFLIALAFIFSLPIFFILAFAGSAAFSLLYLFANRTKI